MRRAEVDARHHRALVRTVGLLHKGEQVIHDEAIEGFLCGTAGIDVACGEPAGVVGGIHDEELHAAGLDQLGHGVDHAVGLPVVRAAAGGRKGDHGMAGLAIDHHVHVAVERRAVDALLSVLHTIHSLMLSRSSAYLCAGT